MNIFLYGRVSTTDQDTGLQKQKLQAKYPEGVYREEKKSGTTTAGRGVLQLILDMIHEGDKLVVWKLDRLARNVLDLSKIVQELESKGATIEIIDQAIDTATASGRAFLQMLGVFAEFETNLRKERQLAGIAKAKADGKHLGRKAILSGTQKAEIKEKRAKGTSPTELAKEYGVSRASIYNIK
ncbi:recombinase family protein [Desulfotalea psychrophila]|nr:recombinase family protein [Desulfotalea psychrophila]